MTSIYTIEPLVPEDHRHTLEELATEPISRMLALIPPIALTASPFALWT